MRNWRTPMLIVAAGLLIAAAANPLFAHHANAVFDITKTVTVKGTVTDWFWANPHCLLRFDVTDENGQVSHWVGETQAPINMIGKGWRRDSFKARRRTHRQPASAQERQTGRQRSERHPCQRQGAGNSV